MDYEIFCGFDNDNDETGDILANKMIGMKFLYQNTKNKKHALLLCGVSPLRSTSAAMRSSSAAGAPQIHRLFLATD